MAEKQKKQDEKERRAAENRAAIQARAEARVEAQAVAAANRQAAAEAKSEAKIKQKVEETIERDLIRPLEKAYNQVVKREVQALLTSMKHTLCLDKKKVAGGEGPRPQGQARSGHQHAGGDPRRQHRDRSRRGARGLRGGP